MLKGILSKCKVKTNKEILVVLGEKAKGEAEEKAEVEEEE